MKRCSTCNRTFTDPNLRFCIDDGTPLTDIEPDDDATVVTPTPRNQPGNQDASWNATAYQPPSSYVPPPGQTRRRRVWPWLVGIAAAFVLGILAIAIAGVLMVPRLQRQVERAERDANRHSENSNTAPAPETNSNTNSTEHVDTPAPTNQEQVLTQLKDIENDWTVANLNADKKKLDQILADDFVAKDDKGELKSKADYIREIQRETEVDKWEFSNLQLTLVGDRATLNGIITYFLDERSVSFDFTDKFVWRDGRWQATGAVIKRRGAPETDL